MTGDATVYHGSSQERLNSFFAALRACWPRPVRRDVSMAAYTTLRAGGVAAGVVDVMDLSELRMIMQLLARFDMPWHLLGHGSNLLVRSRGFDGVFIRLRKQFCRIVRRQEETAGGAVILEVGAGCSIAALTAWCLRHGVGGFEFMVGIPGTVGGAARMNAGAWNEEIASLMQALVVMDRSGESRFFTSTELVPRYRHMDLVGASLDDMVITSVVLQLVMADRQRVKMRCRELMRRRRSKQPLAAGSAGSFFRNPQGDSAGRLIEAAGLKGLRCGQAMVSHRHANFIVNLGDASAADIDRLRRKVQERVHAAFGVRLEPEVVII